MADPHEVLQLCRMDIEEVGANPDKLAAEVLRQLGSDVGDGAVPVHAIARALDIIEIRLEPLDNFEGALLTTPERGSGKILVNSSSSRLRRRFTIAHELGHYLNLSHRPSQSVTEDHNFLCLKSDIGGWSGKRHLNRHQRQEIQANRFAIELLAPIKLMRDKLELAADLEHVLAIADRLELSKEAAARRYVELHDACIAVAFSKNGRLRYWARSQSFPKPDIRPDQQMPCLPSCSDASNPTISLYVEPSEWFEHALNGELFLQTFHQQNGFAMSLLVVENGADTDEEDDDGNEDSFQRFSGFNQR